MGETRRKGKLMKPSNHHETVPKMSVFLKHWSGNCWSSLSSATPMPNYKVND